MNTNEALERNRVNMKLSSRSKQTNNAKSSQTAKIPIMDAKIPPQQTEKSTNQFQEEHELDEEYVKHVQRHTEMHKRELKYELLLDLRSKLEK